jgi:hypothetical protein
MTFNIILFAGAVKPDALDTLASLHDWLTKLSQTLYKGSSLPTDEHIESVSRQLWFGLVNNRTGTNTYSLHLPHLMHANYQSTPPGPPDLSHRPLSAMIIPDSYVDELGSCSSATPYFQVSSTLFMNIRLSADSDRYATSHDDKELWILSKDLRTLSPPSEECWVELLLTDVKYVADFKPAPKVGISTWFLGLFRNPFV